MWKKIFAAIAASLFILTITGCETMQGLGRDIGKLGDKIENKADR
jgi:predicted small secreted protein